jgi:hypothetical protein
MCRFVLGSKFVHAASLCSYLDAVLQNGHATDQLSIVI